MDRARRVIRRHRARGRHLFVLSDGQHLAGHQADSRCGVEITCTDGMLTFDSYSNRLAMAQDGAYQPIEVQPTDPFAEELKNLIRAIHGSEPLKVAPEWGRHIVEVLLAAEESSRTGREVPIASRVEARSH